jgi:hypothetical protein
MWKPRSSLYIRTQRDKHSQSTYKDPDIKDGDVKFVQGEEKSRGL